MPILTPEVNVSTAIGKDLPVTDIPVDAPDIERALAQVTAKQAEYGRWARYYAGDHRLVYATEKFRNAFGDLFYAVADNLCELVVDSIADRLEVVGFGVEKGEKADTVRNAAWEIWQRNRMDERSGLVHSEALRAGDGYVLVWPDPDGQPVVWPQKANLMTVAYDDERPTQLLWAAKVWKSKGKVRLNLYYPERIEKWVTRQKTTDTPSREGQFEAFLVEGEKWPLPNPWGTVPVFHFPNKSWFGCFGTSELTTVIPLQDALNKALCDMLVSMEFNAYQQRWATGIEYEIDQKTGLPKAPFKPGVDRLWAVADKDANFGQFDPAALEQFLEVQESLRVEIARVASLPPHYVTAATGANMSGEALKTAEARFVKKVTQRQRSYGNAWENAMALALRMTNHQPVRLTTEWAAAAPTTESDLLNNLLAKKDLGVTITQLLTEAGYGEQDIKDMATEREKAVDTQRRRFNEGLPDPAEEGDKDGE